jgi:hypothetical protein
MARLICAVGLNRVAVFVYDAGESAGGGTAGVIGHVECLPIP